MHKYPDKKIAGFRHLGGTGPVLKKGLLLTIPAFTILVNPAGRVYKHFGKERSAGNNSAEMANIEEKVFREGENCSGDCDSCGSSCSTFDPKKNTMTITTDDDEELECQVINIFQAKEQKYIVLLPTNSEDGEGWLFRFYQDKGDNPRLENIEDPKEYEFAAAVFENLMNNVHFEENGN